MIGGVGDLYLTCMIWFIFDDENYTKILLAGQNTYTVIPVIKPRNSTIAEDSSSDSEEEEETSYSATYENVKVSEMMFAKFFDRREGPEQFQSDDQLFPDRDQVS